MTLNIGLVALCLCYSSATIHLYVVEKEIQLGKPLHLSCEISNHIKGTRKWIGGRYDETLCVNGVSSNSAKYSEIRLSSSHFLLKIEAVNESDLNYQYACWVGFFIGQMTLSVNESNFNYLPEDDTTHVRYVKENGSYSLQVRIDLVFPVPSCIAETLPKPRKLTVLDKMENGIFYAVEFSDQSKEPFHICGGPVEIECTIKDSKFTISRPHSLECNGFSHTSNQRWVWTVIGIGTLIVFLAVVVIIAVVKICRKNNRYRTYWNSLIESGLLGLLLGSTESGNSAVKFIK